MSRRPDPAVLRAAYRTHARRRYRERWGKKLTTAGYAALCRAAGDPSRSRLLHESDDRAVFVVLFRGEFIRVVVDLPLEVVVTVLPPTAFQPRPRHVR